MMKGLKLWQKFIAGMLVLVLLGGMATSLQKAFADNQNLIANPSVETAVNGSPSSWTPNSWGNNSATLSYTNTGHTGNFSLLATMKNRVDGDAKWIPNAASISGGQSYTYSDYYKSDVSTEIDAQYTDTSGNVSYVYLGEVPVSSSWAPISETFVAPSNAVKVSILHIIAANGTLQTDDFSLTANMPPPPGTNIVPNPSVETPDPANIHQPKNWHKGSWGTNTVSFAYLNSGHSGTHSIKTTVTSYTSGSAYWMFDSQPIVGGNTYDYSDYFESNVGCGVDATITMQDGSVQYLHLGETFPSTKSWTQFRTQFTAPIGAVAINIVHNIYSVGWLTTDDFSLTPFSYQGFNKPIVSITDDDGYSSYYNNGLPVLQKYNLTATDYIISGYVNDPGYMTSSMVKGLYAAGHEIGSHSVDHPDLTTLGTTKMDNELKNSQISLQKLLGVPVTDYAAPYGTYNQQVIADAQNYYKSYRTVQAGYNAKNNFDPYHLMVQNVVSTTTTADIQKWLAEAQATNTWLIIVYHQVDPNVSAGVYNTYPSDFDAQMSAVKASGMPVETVSQAMAELQSQL